MKKNPIVDVESIMARIQSRLLRRNKDEYLQSLSALPEVHRSLWSTWIVQCEVENGGFAQYFWNIEAEGFYDLAESGFIALGATEPLEIFRNARKLITPHLRLMRTWQGSDDRFTKYKPLLKKEGISNRFYSLDEQFFSLKPPFSKVRERYIEANVQALTI